MGSQVQDSGGHCYSCLRGLEARQLGSDHTTAAVQELRSVAATEALSALTQSAEGCAGLLAGIQSLMTRDATLRLQLQLMLAEQDSQDESPRKQMANGD